MDNLKQLLKQFASVRVLIVGDVMLDRYCWGEINRISPEAPVPVVALGKTTMAAGGAANVAANVAGLGAKPHLFGITGDDADAALLPSILRDANIKGFSLPALKGRQTTVKTRVVANNQHVVRIDHETTEPITRKDAAAIMSKIEKVLDKHDVVVISDYAKGFLTTDLLARLIAKATRKGKPVLADPKGKDFTKYRGVTLLTPNERETAEACHLEHNRQDLIDKGGKMLLTELELKSLLVTQGAKGMTLLQSGENAMHLKASARKVFDVTGAGDTVLASLAVAIGSGLSIVDSARFANFAAGLVVEQVGTTAISKQMIEDHPEFML